MDTDYINHKYVIEHIVNIKYFENSKLKFLQYQ